MKKLEDIRERVTKLLATHANRPLTATEIADALKISGKTRKQFRKWLNHLIVEGSIVRIRGQRFSLGSPADLVAGTLSVVRSGNGYLAVAGAEPDVFIFQRDLDTALPGDRVLVRLAGPATGRADTGPSGCVIRILERSRRDIVGTYRSTGRFGYVVPLGSGYSHDFYVDKPRGARINDRVVIRFTGWQNRHVNPEAEIIEVLGPDVAPSVDTISIIRQHQLPEAFPAAVMGAAESASAAMDRPGRRVDLRGRYTITIDPQKARDFDDALSLELDPKGNRVLGVHIADVSHFVRPGSAMDKEARLRGNSVYLPDKVIPMLPEQLSNGICSLRPREDRLAFSVMITFTSSGEVLASSFAKTQIRSKQRLTYEQVMSHLDGADSARGTGPRKLPAQAGSLLRELNALAQTLRTRRFARHALDLDMPECEVEFGPDGSIAGIRSVPNDISHQLVEECMLAANETVARELAEHEFPLINRFHARPSRSKIEALAEELAEMGMRHGNLGSRRGLARFLRDSSSDPLSYHVRLAVLRSMSRAVYSVAESGHFGLAKKFYAHFTSPIRRYPDLVTHRQLATLLLKRSPSVYDSEDMSEVAAACSQTEQTAEIAERELLEIKKCRFLADQIEKGNPRVYPAVVVKVVNFGMFLDVPDLQIQGMVHVSAISDRFVRFNRRTATLHSGRDVYKRGDRMEVIVSHVDLDKRRIDFSPA